MSSELTVTIYGARGSYPVSGEEFSQYGGATSCVVVETQNRQIIFDAGSGIIAYGKKLLGRALANDDPVHTSILFSHSHFDHLIGLPYFPPIFHPSSTIHLAGPRTGRFPSFQATIEHLIRSPFYPVALHDMGAKKEYLDFAESDSLFYLRGRNSPLKLRPLAPGDADAIPDESEVEIRIDCLRGYNHPKSGVNIYRLNAGETSIVYATDTEGYVHGDQRLADFAQGADLLIHDAMYTEEHYTAMPVPTQGYGHSTVKIATNLAAMADVDQLCLFHHDPASTDAVLDDVGHLASEYFPNTVVASDGLCFQF